MRAMVFAAGRGERLCPLTDSVPKALVPVAGRPMIEYPLLLLRHYGIRDIVVNLHHLGEQIEKLLGDGGKFGLKITYSKEKELLDTGGGLLHARAFLQRETFVVINCDVMIDLRLDELLRHHRKHKALATLVLREDPRADNFGPIEISPDLRIQTFLGYRAARKKSAAKLAKFMFTGVQILEPEIFRHMKTEASMKFGMTRSTYPKALTGGEFLLGFPFSGFWQDLGTPERISEAEKKLQHGLLRLHYL